MQKRILALALALALAVSAAGCAAPAEPKAETEAHARTVFAMDTVMNLTVYGGSGDAATDAAVREIYRLDALLARGVEGSAVYAYNHGAAADEELRELLALAEEIAAATGGAFDAYLGGVLDLWGFGSGAGERRVPSDAELAAAPRLLDLGGIAKGLAGQRVCETLRRNGAQSAIVDLGGDVALLGKKPGGADWRVAVRDPAGSGYLGVLQTGGDCYVATSGVYERFFEENGVRYHHILDPKTGRPADSGIVSATVLCASGPWADALATAACVLGAERALRLRESLAAQTPFDLILVTEDGRVLCTCGGFTPESDAQSRYAFEQIS